MAARCSQLLASLVAFLLPLSSQANQPSRDVSLPVSQHAAPATTYNADFFAVFAPQSAYDIVRHVPGFVISQGETLRGFAVASSNVLINGARPAVKGDFIEDILRRIPASKVERVELLRGGDLAEAPGQTLVANLIIREMADAGAATVMMTYWPDKRMTPEVELTRTSRLGPWEVMLSGSFEIEHEPWRGTRQTFDATDQRVRLQNEREMVDSCEFSVSGSAARDMAGGRLVLTGRLAHLDEKERYDLRDVAANRADLIDYGARYWDGELSGDWTRPLRSGWNLKLTGITRLEYFGALHQEESQQPLLQRSMSHLNQHPFETIVRGSLVKEREGKRYEIGGEGAYNRLTSSLKYISDMGGGEVPLALPADRAHVNEKRAEIFAKGSRPVTNDLSLEAGLAYEISRISAKSQATSTLSLSYWKPSFGAVWRPNLRNQFRFDFQRKVGQLEFEDFAASTEAGEDREFGGNLDLRPETALRLSLSYDYHIGDLGALSVELWHEWRRDVIDFVRLPSGNLAVGNIGQATAWGSTTSVTLPVPMIEGGEIQAQIYTQSSRVFDPIRGEKRRLSDMTPVYGTVEFRQDLPAHKFAWGVTWVPRQREEFFYPGENYVEHRSAIWSTFIETTAFAGVKTTLRFQNIGNQGFATDRRFFIADQGRQLLRREFRSISQGTNVSLIVAKQF